MRSLDAIHLASAVADDADLFIGYDKRLLVVAEEMGFRTLSPGVDQPWPVSSSPTRMNISPSGSSAETDDRREDQPRPGLGTTPTSDGMARP